MTLRTVGKILLYGCAGILSVIVLLMLAVKLALDRAPRYQAEIKDWVHDRTGYHISFARISPAFRWYGPELYFERLELRSKDGRQVLARAAGGRIGADIRQLLHSGHLLAGRIELDAPSIAIARTGRRNFALGPDIELGGGGARLPLLDDLPLGALAIRHGTVLVRNWNSALPVLELRDVNCTLSHATGLAMVALAARLPATLGGVFSINGTARGSGRLDALDWSALGRTAKLSLAGWRELLPDYLSSLDAGTGGFEVTARGGGANLSAADVVFDAADVIVQSGAEPGAKFDQVAGELTIRHAGDRWALTGRRMRALRNGRSDPDSDLDVSWRGGDAGVLELHAGASYLRADTLLPLAGLLPQEDLREHLQEIAPTGEWFNTRLNAARAGAGDPWRFDVEARFRGAGFAAIGRAPGLRGLSGTVAGTESGGRVDIDTDTGEFSWPGQFPQAVDLTVFKTTLYWNRTADRVLIATPSVELKTRDANLHAKAAWLQPADGGSPVLTLAATVDDGNVAQAHQFFPRGLLPAPALAWMDRAFVAGHLPHADAVFQGPVRHFPFRDGSGLFLVRAHVDGMTLDYREGWPRAENLALSAEFRNAGLRIQLQAGRVGGATVESGDARFADFKTGELQLHAAAAGDAADALGYLRATPLDAMAEHAFSGVEAGGPMQSDVDLFLPFKNFEQRRVVVHAHLHGVSLHRTGSTLAATDLNGDVDIEGAQVSHADVHGRILGGAFEMRSRTPRFRPLTRTLLVFNGTVSGDALHSALSLPANVAVGGTADWHGVLRMAAEPDRERTLRVNSNLTGLELNLPEPLAKPAGRPMPTLVEVEWPPNDGPQILLDLGSVLRARMSLDAGTDEPQLRRAAVTFGAGSSSEPPQFSDAQVINAGGKIDHLDLTGWLKLYTPDRNAKPMANFLRGAKFEVAQIDYLGLVFVDVSVDLAATEAGWRIGTGGPNVVGSISIPGAVDATQPWTLDFQRLKFLSGSGDAGPGAVTAAVAASVTEVANPRSIPAINFHAGEMIWDERQLGDVKATLVRLDDGIGLEQLQLAGENFTAHAKGEWRGRGEGLARIEGTLSSTDVGGTLKQLGYDAVIEAKTGKLDFDLNWKGAPSDEALRDVTGHVEAVLGKGQITGIKPGAGRVLGLASLTALPRRLALDFSDLTDKGLAFDSVRGDFDLHDGSAYTDDVLLKGPAAEVGLIGRVGLKNKDYDQTAVVTGNVSSSLPLAAFAAGPVVGGAVLLFTQVFKQPLQGLARGYYRITGNWDNPTVERIKSADAAAATAEESK